jgi:uncharacterized membrane protein
MNFAQNVASWLMGAWGIATIVLGVAGMFIAAAVGMIQPRAGFVAAGCGVMAWTGAYVIRNFLT